MATKQQYKGPRKYEHGADSTFALAAFSVQGKWTTIYSRSRPGSRSNKVFTDEQQLLHLRSGFTDKGKGFQMFSGDFLFAYIAHKSEGQNWKSALYFWTPNDGWKTGVPPSLPVLSPTPVWKFGAQGSTIYLHIKNAAGWLPKIWGWDRQNENALVEFPLTEQIKRLQVQFSNGGHDKCRFDPAEVIQAHIACREGGSVKNSLCWFTPEKGWQEGTKPYQPDPAHDPATPLPEMIGKLWVTGPDLKAETIRPNTFLRI